ncbi:hypothetical protein KY334_06570 [Candidatus Woesearchaeota archaeon]|nr:hypothetical protein [Candidatus Woesearchaeota archaeon]
MVKASIVIMSHLNDVKEHVNIEFEDFEEEFYPEELSNRIDFVNYLILKLDGDLNKEIDPEKMFNEFLKFKKERN